VGIYFSFLSSTKNPWDLFATENADSGRGRVEEEEEEEEEEVGRKKVMPSLPPG